MWREVSTAGLWKVQVGAFSAPDTSTAVAGDAVSSTATSEAWQCLFPWELHPARDPVMAPLANQLLSSLGAPRKVRSPDRLPLGFDDVAIDIQEVSAAWTATQRLGRFFPWLQAAGTAEAAASLGDALAQQLGEVLEAAVRRHLVLPLAQRGEASLAPSGPDATAGATIAILFSGGLDCAVLAALAHRVLPADSAIDLLNVAFGIAASTAPDRVTARATTAELRSAEHVRCLPVSWACARLTQACYGVRGSAARLSYTQPNVPRADLAPRGD